MLYRPQNGRIWDPTVVKANGVYHLFSMYYEDGAAESYAMRLAVSADGVHWEDQGNLIESDQPVWKMGVFRTADGVYGMNHGSRSGRPGHGNDTLVYYRSEDLLHWERLYEDHPDPRWYEPAERWDHMYCRPSGQGGYIGYAVATPIPEIGGMLGVQRSDDGLRWRACPPPVIEWDGMEPTREIEVGGCERIGGRYYLIGGVCPPHNGNYAYSVYTYVADREDGPFRPDREALRLCGANGLTGQIFMQTLAAFCRNYDEPDALLVSNTLWYALDSEQNCNWMLPLRAARVDAEGHLRLWYFDGNEALKGRPLAHTLPRRRVLYRSAGAGTADDTAARLFAVAGGEQAAALTVSGDGLEAATDALPGYQLEDRQLIVELAQVDPTRGAVLEATLTVSPCPAAGAVRAGCWRPTLAGLYLEQQTGSGTALLLETGAEAGRQTWIGPLDLRNGFDFRAADVTGPGCATLTGLTAGRPHRFRLLLRYGMFELYVDDRLVQTYTTGALPNGRIGLALQNASCTLSGLRLWEMDL